MLIHGFVLGYGMVLLNPVAVSQGVRIYCPEDGMFSFFNSPYPSHKLTTGIDVYPNLNFMELAPSPVSGEVLQIRKVKAPKGRLFQDAGYDVAVLLRSNENKDIVIKLLHMNPCVEVGDWVKVGDFIGSLLRSGYYGWGTSPHIHVEVRRPEDPLRARGGHQIERIQNLHYDTPEDEIKGVVVDSRDEFTIVELNSENGLVADMGGKPGILDGGIPYYGWMGVHFDGEFPRGHQIKLGGTLIGVINNVGDNWCQARCLDFRFEVNRKRLRGLSLRLSPKGPASIKLIPYELGALRMESGEEVKVSAIVR